MAALLRETPDPLLPKVAYLCQGQMAPEFTGVEVGLAEKMVTRSLIEVTGVPAEQVRATCGRPATSARPPSGCSPTPPGTGRRPSRSRPCSRPCTRSPPPPGPAPRPASSTGAELTLSPNHTAAWGQAKEDVGLAVRFPRFTGRYRDDKAPEDATTTQEVLDMYRTARPTPAGS